MNRRRLLGTLGAGALTVPTAGCLSGVLGGCSNPMVYRLDLTPVDPAAYGRERAAALHGPTEERIVRLGARNATPYVPWNGDPRLDDDTVYELDGAYYRVAVAEKGPRTEVTAHEYRVRTDETVRAAATPEATVELAALPRPDRAVLLTSAVGRRLDPDERTATFSETVTFAIAPEYAREQSAFVPDQQYRYVRYGETVLEFTLADTRKESVLPRWVRVTPVGESAADYGRGLLSDRGIRVESDSLSPAAREYVGNALDGGVETRVCSGEDPPEHVPEVLSAFGLADDPVADPYVAYDGRWYRAEFDHYQVE